MSRWRHVCCGVAEQQGRPRHDRVHPHRRRAAAAHRHFRPQRGIQITGRRRRQAWRWREHASGNADNPQADRTDAAANPADARAAGHSTRGQHEPRAINHAIPAGLATWGESGKIPPSSAWPPLAQSEATTNDDTHV
jgi:hypothetical protein